MGMARIIAVIWGSSLKFSVNANKIVSDVLASISFFAKCYFVAACFSFCKMVVLFVRAAWNVAFSLAFRKSIPSHHVPAQFLNQRIS